MRYAARSISCVTTGVHRSPHSAASARQSPYRRGAHLALLHVADGERVVLIASNWGRQNHPAWALNLDANHEARVAVDGVERLYRARRATPEEESRYWRDAVAFWPGYDDYRGRARRETRMFALEPAE